MQLGVRCITRSFRSHSICHFMTYRTMHQNCFASLFKKEIMKRQVSLQCCKVCWWIPFGSVNLFFHHILLNRTHGNSPPFFFSPAPQHSSKGKILGPELLPHALLTADHGSSFAGMLGGGWEGRQQISF